MSLRGLWRETAPAASDDDLETSLWLDYFRVERGGTKLSRSGRSHLTKTQALTVFRVDRPHDARAAGQAVPGPFVLAFREFTTVTLCNGPSGIKYYIQTIRRIGRSPE